ETRRIVMGYFNQNHLCCRIPQKIFCRKFRVQDATGQTRRKLCGGSRRNHRAQALQALSSHA
ncbi:hypothetical protein, partial [Xanthomonas vasicola]|uniref:hypothetical protein n=1 Tax=Xanthomonas vasicola TaxID=56459 RepID=UPI001C8327D5